MVLVTWPPRRLPWGPLSRSCAGPCCAKWLRARHTLAHRGLARDFQLLRLQLLFVRATSPSGLSQGTDDRTQ